MSELDKPLTDEKSLQVELIISNLLRVGVWISLSVIIFGIILTFAHHANYRSDPAALKPLIEPGAKFSSTLGDVLTNARQLQGRAVVTLGLLLLIATPVFRVAVSIVAFWIERDRRYVIITTIVLLLLILSFALGKVEG